MWTVILVIMKRVQVTKSENSSSTYTETKWVNSELNIKPIYDVVIILFINIINVIIIIRPITDSEI